MLIRIMISVTAVVTLLAAPSDPLRDHASSSTRQLNRLVNRVAVPI